MGAESRGRAWFGKIYNKLETILVEVDTFTSQNTLCLKSIDPPALESVKVQPKKVADDRAFKASTMQEHHDRVASPRCESPSDPPSHQNFDILGHVRVEERTQGDSSMENSSASSLSDDEILSTSTLLEEYCDASLTSTTKFGDEDQVITDEEESQILPDGEISSTSPLLDENHDANLTSATNIGDKEPIVTDEESQITNTLTPQKISDEPKEVSDDHSSGASIVEQHHDFVASPSWTSTLDPPSHQTFDISGHVQVEERVQGDILKENLVQGDSFKDDSSASSSSEEDILSTSPFLEEYCDATMTPATTLDDEEAIITDEVSKILHEIEILSTSPVLEEYCDTNMTSATTLGDEETITTDEESKLLHDVEILSTSPLREEYRDANLTSATTLGDEEPIIIDEESQITNTLNPQRLSAGNSLVSPGEESVEDVEVESCRDVYSTESQSSESSLETFGSIVEYNDDHTLAELGYFTDDSNLYPIATKILDAPVQDDVANMRSSNADNPDDVINGKSDDVAPLYGIELRENPTYVDDNALYALSARTIALLDTDAFYGIEFREDPSCVDDSALHAMRLRAEKLRSFKRKILDALTSKRRREKEYEQLAIWFGDADMGSDLATEEDSKQVEAMDSESSHVLGSENSQWELL